MGIGKLFGSSKPTPQKTAAGPEQDDLGKLFAVLEIAPDGKILAANARACDLYGLGKAALLDKTYDELLPADGPNAANVLATAGSSGGEPVTGQRTSGGGQVINVKARFLPVKGPDNKIRSYREVSYKSEGSTSSAHDVAWKFMALSRSLAIIEFEPTGVILWANDNFLGAMGYQLDEIQGNHHSMFVSDEIKNSHEYKSFWGDLQSGEFKSDAFERKGKGGKEIWIQATYNPVFDDDGNVVKVIKAATDITSHRSAQKTISDCLQLLSEGKLEARIPGDIDEDFATIRNTFNSSMDRLAEMISKIKETGTRIAQESEAVGQSAYDLSRRTEGQAAALEETSASMDEIANKVAENSANAKRTTEIATNATERSQRGGKIVTDAVQAMSRIEESSTKVSEIVSVIEAIAFQTNLLALNAAVEAARAGDAGKGFAVVAAEVRSLAQRSSEAAKDIAELIQRSVGEVNDGAQLVRQTGSALDEITSSFEDMRDSVNDITEASVAQSNSVNEIRHAIKGLDDRTQQNAGMAEQSVSYATTLGELVAELKALTEYFSGDGIPAISAAGGTDVQMFDDDNEDWQAKMPMQGAA